MFTVWEQCLGNLTVDTIQHKPGTDTRECRARALWPKANDQPVERAYLKGPLVAFGLWTEKPRNEA